MLRGGGGSRWKLNRDNKKGEARKHNTNTTPQTPTNNPFSAGELAAEKDRVEAQIDAAYAAAADELRLDTGRVLSLPPFALFCAPPPPTEPSNLSNTYRTYLNPPTWKICRSGQNALKRGVDLRTGHFLRLIKELASYP